MKCECKQNICLLNCKYCKICFCTTCILPEIHKCIGTVEMVNAQKEVLAKLLREQKTTRRKIEVL